MNNVNNKKQALLDEYRERISYTSCDGYTECIEGEVAWLKSRIDELQFDEEKAYDQGFKDAKSK